MEIAALIIVIAFVLCSVKVTTRDTPKPSWTQIADAYRSVNEAIDPWHDMAPDGKQYGIHNWPPGHSHPIPGSRYPNGDLS